MNVSKAAAEVHRLFVMQSAQAAAVKDATAVVARVMIVGFAFVMLVPIVVIIFQQHVVTLVQNSLAPWHHATKQRLQKRS